MKYEWEGKTYNISDAELERNMKLLDLTKEEAIQMWLEDHDLYCSPERAELNAKFEANKKDLVPHGKAEKKERKPVKRERKPNEDKRTIISWLKVLFEGFALNGEVENVAVANIEREVTFTMGDVTYSVTLTAHRKPKGEKGV